VPPGSEEKIDLSKLLAPPQGEGELGRLAQYRVLKILGKGGMGMVLLAEDSHLQRMTALKIMLPQYASNPQFRERFLREARAAAKIKHDNVVTIHQVGIGDEHGIPFIAMEYLKGRPLDQHLKESGEMSIGQVLKIGREMAEGLQAAHAEGLIHRDIKPGNIWLEFSGEPPTSAGTAPASSSRLNKFRVKILDFGLAREEQDDVHLTKSGAVVGTPAYMSPEQAEGEAVDHRTDLFSLGVVLYRLCTGKLPFAGSTTIAVLRALAFNAPTPVRQLNSHVPATLELLIHLLLEKNPAKRLPSAADVVEALEKIDKPDVPGTPKVVKEVVYVVPTASAEAVDPFTNIDATPSSVQPVKSAGEKGAEKTEEGKKSGGKPLLWAGLGVGALLAAAVVLVVIMSSRFFGDGPKKSTLPAENNDIVRGDDAPGRSKDVVKKVDPPKASPDRKAAEMLHAFFQITYRLADGKARYTCKPTEPLPTGPFTIVGLGIKPGDPSVRADLFLTAVADLKSIDTFYTIYSNPKLTDAELLKMAAMPFANNLITLEVKNFELTQKSIEALKKFPNLTRLMCSATTVDDSFLAQLAEGLPKLNLLNLDGLGKSGKVTERGVAELAKLPLKVLWLHFDRQLITPAVCQIIAGFPELTHIHSYGSFGDAEFAALAKCPKLHTLALYGNLSITDTGLNDSNLTLALRLLEIKNATVSETAVKKLAKTLPKCKIIWSGREIGPLDKSVTPPPSDDLGSEFEPADQPALLQAPFTKEQAEKSRGEWAAFLKIPERKQIELPEGVKLEVVLIPPGRFRMGTEGNTTNEVPHDVTITKPFYMAVTETTQEQYEAVTGKNPSGFAPNGRIKEKIDTRRWTPQSFRWKA
jgi:serine/threonine protein kinase